MALSNRERVARAFELLAAGLQPYIERKMRAASRSGSAWMREFPRDDSPNDPAFQLRVMADRWDDAFRDELTRTDRNLVFELRDVRNRWAHNKAFSADDAYRALDSIERLLVAASAAENASVARAYASGCDSSANAAKRDRSAVQAEEGSELRRGTSRRS